MFKSIVQKKKQKHDKINVKKTEIKNPWVQKKKKKKNENTKEY